MAQYAFTLKWNSFVENRGNYTDLYRHALTLLRDNQKIKIRMMVEEFDSNGILHLHGIYQVPRAIIPVKGCLKLPITGYHHKVKPLTDLIGWTQYCYGSKGNYSSGPNRGKPKPSNTRFLQCPTTTDDSSCNCKDCPHVWGPGKFREFFLKPYDKEIVIEKLESLRMSMVKKLNLDFDNVLPK